MKQLFLVLVFTTAMALSTKAQQQQKQITIQMPSNGWEIVMKGLGKLPLEESAQVYTYIQQQIIAQSKQLPPAKDTLQKNTKKDPAKKP